jgi:hypothetical protein
MPRQEWVPATSPTNQPGDLAWTGAGEGDVVEVLRLPVSGLYVPFVSLDGGPCLRSDLCGSKLDKAKRDAVEAYRVQRAYNDKQRGGR